MQLVTLVIPSLGFGRGSRRLPSRYGDSSRALGLAPIGPAAVRSSERRFQTSPRRSSASRHIKRLIYAPRAPRFLRSHCDEQAQAWWGASCGRPSPGGCYSEELVARLQVASIHVYYSRPNPPAHGRTSADLSLPHLDRAPRRLDFFPRTSEATLARAFIS